MGEGSTPGLMEEGLKAIGRTITCMGGAFTPGKMAGSTKESTSMTKSTAMGSTYGQMVDDTRETGQTANNMERESTTCPTGL